MVKRSVPLETGETVCPACGAGIRTTPSPKRRRVQCPKCRQVVVLESAERPEPTPSPEPAEKSEATTEARDRLELLESRVELLEAALAGAMAAAHAATSPGAQRRWMWVSATPGQAPDFSAEQGHALSFNLATVRSQAITIRTPAGDRAAWAHAEWFKSIFERAGWTVHGPEEITPRTAVSGLCLAVPGLPVPKDAADTYLAMKAAGFEPNPVLSSGRQGESGERIPVLSLTVSGRVA